jgi:hypothetical protein
MYTRTLVVLQCVWGFDWWGVMEESDYSSNENMIKSFYHHLSS